MRQFPKHIFCLGMLLVSMNASAARVTTDMLADAVEQWRSPDIAQWTFSAGEIAGTSKLFDGEKSDPDATTFLISKQTFGGNVSVEIDVLFEKGRYLGVYLDFGQDSQSGIWMATGNPLSKDAPANEIERGYIKTVENGFWIVRANGELVVNENELVRLRFARLGDDYSLYRDERLVAIYHKPGGYPAGPIQIRLTNAKVRIQRLQVESDWTR